VRLVNWFNRAVVVLVLLALVAGGLAVSFLPAVVAGGLRSLAGLLEGAQFLALAGIGLPVALLALLVLALELRVRRPSAVSLASGGGAEVSTETVVQRLRSDVEAIAEVDQARPVVTPRRGRVDVELAVTTAPQVDVPTKAAEVSQVARETIEKLGLKLGKLNVRLSHTSRGWAIGRGGGDAGQPALGGGTTTGTETGGTS
jgi:hypothetical protein